MVTAPRAARYMGRLGVPIPIWIACRSNPSSEIGHVWQYLCKFTRIAIPPLSTAETQRLIAETIAAGNIQSDAGRHMRELHRLSAGDPRKLDTALPKEEFRSRPARA
ncbi:MAG: hypothetical protein ACR2MW_07310 [Chthoniobacterales bacterium]